MNNETGKRNYQTGFIPHKLEVGDRPELSDFSKNILFANVFSSNGVDMIASSLYEPDLETYTDEGAARSLTYRNIYNPDNRIKVTRYEDKWEGEKFINGTRSLWAFGRTWQQFFIQLTILGLSKGERCQFERLDELLKKTKEG
ncbi:MAG: hypothetical protein UT08_C0013G0011 [Candidatus Woesebacteria bacterium GW2011_GWB1_38_8]|uniref:Uncharacterized protein n=1 Tax=Candidatus Woesebacteria bacterium GW2011_GWB1_38_8 TaxID=1618570 RepID=A0A0G0NG47_9BACT|nr:MAG: hypothetical protein UT08_C0013G0011 [Candidatus Woesebacteria bacterium GW2011_GWB1_38_8]